MKFLANLSLIAAILLCNSCYRIPAARKGGSFATPFGYIVKGDSMRDVVKLLGNPREVSHYRHKEVWRYNFSQTGELFVYFEKGDVVDIQFSSQPKESNGCGQSKCSN